MIIGINYSVLTTRSLDIHGRNAGNFIVSQLHPTKSGVTIEGNKGIMGKQTCLLFNQLNKTNSIRRRLKN